MFRLDMSRQINRPAEQVFSVLADFPSYLAQWAKGPTAAALVSGDGGAGTEYLVTARVGPFKVRSPYHVTASEPPLRFAGSGTAGPVRFEEEYTVTARGHSCALRYVASAHGRGPFRLLERFIERRLGRLISGDLNRFEALVERVG